MIISILLGIVNPTNFVHLVETLDVDHTIKQLLTAYTYLNIIMKRLNIHSAGIHKNGYFNMGDG